MNVRFKIERNITGYDVDELWKKLSDIESIPEFWHGHREVKVLERNGNVYKVQIRYAFPSFGNGNLGESIIEVDEKMKVLSFKNYKGPVKGSIKVWIDEGEKKMVCVYDVSMSAIYLPTKNWIENHFKQGVERAFDRLLTP
ncbi:MAG: SRPBCC family protein [Nitrososphaeria archaeon]